MAEKLITKSLRDFDKGKHRGFITYELGKSLEKETAQTKI